MQPNPNGMNEMLRSAGNRSRALPNIGQTPAVQAANAVMGQQPAPVAPQGAPAPMAAPASFGPSPMAAPPVQQNTMTLHPPGSPADPTQYNYEPQPDGAWRVYPPGVSAPNHAIQASLPRAASTADYKRMRQAFTQMPQTPTG